MSLFSDTLYQAAFPPNSAISMISDTIELHKTRETRSFLTSTQTSKHNFIKETRPQTSGVNSFWVLLGSLIVIAFINLNYHKQYKYAILGFFLSKYKSLNIEKENNNKIASFALSLVYFVNIALLFHLAAPLLQIEIPTFYAINIYWVILIFVVVFSLGKSLFVFGSIIIFSNLNQGKALIRINNESQWVATILLLPFNFVLRYTSNSMESLIVISSLLAIIFIIKQLKLYFNIRIASSYYTYQIILYLCILEILPIMVILRYLTY